MIENTIDNSKKNQKVIWIVILVIGGILLLVLGGRYDERSKQTSADVDTYTSAYSEADAYARIVEERVRQMCMQVEGVDGVSVLVSLKGGYRTVYAFDSQASGNTYKSEVVMSGSGSDKKAVVSSYENPEISGVGIVCSGADDVRVRNQIISLVAAALDISTNKIFVAAA